MFFSQHLSRARRVASDRRRILHIIDSLSIGGAEKLLVDLAARSIASGADVAVAYFTEGPLRQDLERLGVSPVRLSKHKLRDPRAAWRLWRLIRAFQPMVVHTHLAKSDALGHLVARADRVPVRISTVHNVDQWRRSPVWSRVMRAATAGAHRFVAVSKEVERFTRTWGGCDPDRLVTIPNGIDVNRFGPVEPKSDSTAPLIVGAVGRLVPEKGHSTLIEAAARMRDTHPHLRVVIYGTGPLEPRLRDEIRERGLSGVVTLAGTTDDMPAAMRGFDVLAFPSEWEGLPVALLEGMASGLAVVATPVGGIPDVIDHQVDGLLAEGDVASFVKALERLADDQALRDELGRAARKKVEQDYTLATNAARLDRLYDEVAGAGRAAIKVLSVTKSTGGLAFYNTRLVARLASRGLDVEVACLSENGPAYAAELTEMGIPAVAMPMSRYRIDPRGDARLARRLHRHVVANGYDVLIGHGSKSGFLVRLVGKTTGTPAVYGLASLSFVERTQGRKAAVYRVLERIGHRLGGEIVTVARSTRRDVIDHGIAPPDRVTAIHTGVDLAQLSGADRDASRQRLGVSEEDVLVGWAARFVTQKAPEVFVEAAAKLGHLENVVFVMAGDGPQRDLVDAGVRASGLGERFRVLPWQEDVFGFYAALDVSVLSSRWEGLPQSLLEAMAVGVASIATAVDGNVEAIEDEVSGLLVPADDPAALAAAIERVAVDPRLRAKLARGARQRVETAFSMESMVDGWVDLLERLARR